MRNDIIRGRVGALRPLSARELCSFVHVVAVLALALGHDQRLRDAGATCVPADPEDHSGAHCTPAPGAAAPAPPAAVVLERSDALPQPPAAAAARSVLARAPAPDLAGLSISRT